ncbi:hypothetical protein ACSFA0_26420 [Variovorax sp. LT1P1]|uniref:hypothetical protein n=1 Tax=Variovorax sp. LT1P1 TaxID=3443730 RepID=UPI003F472CFA
MKTFSGYDVKKFWADELFWVDAVSVDDVLMKIDGIDAPDADIEGLADGASVQFESGYVEITSLSKLPSGHLLSVIGDTDVESALDTWLLAQTTETVVIVLDVKKGAIDIADLRASIAAAHPEARVIG